MPQHIGMVSRSLLFVLALVASTLALSPVAGAAPPTCDGMRATVVGIPDPDGGRTVIMGTPGDDVIVGTSGHDVIRALDGNDVVCAGGGRDVVFGGRGRDVIRGEGGMDKMIGGAGADTVYGGAARDVLKGGSGSDRVLGGAGDDRCYDEKASFACELVNGEPATGDDGGALNVGVENIDAPVSTALWTAEIEREIRRLVNVERANAGVDQLTFDPELNNGSRAWSAFLGSSGNFYHDPNLDWHVGENIAQNYWLGERTIRTARLHAAQLMDQWMNSTGHRNNILRNNYYRLGVGVVMQGHLSYATQRFSILQS